MVSTCWTFPVSNCWFVRPLSRSGPGLGLLLPRSSWCFHIYEGFPSWNSDINDIKDFHKITISVVAEQRPLVVPAGGAAGPKSMKKTSLCCSSSAELLHHRRRHPHHPHHLSFFASSASARSTGQRSSCHKTLQEAHKCFTIKFQCNF